MNNIFNDKYLCIEKMYYYFCYVFKVNCFIEYDVINFLLNMFMMGFKGIIFFGEKNLEI